MKKRHQQKLIIVSLVLLSLFNIPLVLMFNQYGSVWGFPTMYFFIFLIWAAAICVSAIILNRYHE